MISPSLNFLNTCLIFSKVPNLYFESLSFYAILKSETLAISISDNANKIAGSIRAKLSEEEDKKAIPIIEEKMEGVYTFVTLPATGYVLTKSEKVDALEKAEEKLIELMQTFDYENQLA